MAGGDDTIAVALDALTGDAALWDGVADSLDRAAADVTAIEIYRGAFSFAATDVADVYASARELVIRLLGDGAAQSRGAATALREIRAEFESYEESVRAELEGMWEPE